MVKKSIVLAIAHLLLVFGCVPTKETVEKKEPVPKVTAGMGKAEVLAKEEDAKPIDRISEETLDAQNAYEPKEGDTVYVNCFTNSMRYIPLKSNPTKDGKVLKAVCIGTELGVVTVQDRWLCVKGVEDDSVGWVLRQWVTDDRSVKIDAEKRRKEHAPEVARLEAIVKPIPESNWKENLRLYQKLLGLDPCNLHYQSRVDFYENYGRLVKKGKRK